MVALGRPGVGEELLASHGFEDVERMVVPFAWEFPDPEAYARALAATGPAYEAIQAVGEEEFLRRATEVAQEHVRVGLPLRAEIDVVGYLARAPQQTSGAWPHDTRPGSFLSSPPRTAEARRLYDEDAKDVGFVMNVTRLWGHLPDQLDGLFDLMGQAKSVASLSMRERGILVAATASALGDSYCALAWGEKLARVSDASLAAAVLTGADDGLSAHEQALAAWARQVVTDPNAATVSDLDGLREAGYDEAQILAITFFICLRMAFSAVNDALGARPDRELVDRLPDVVRSAVTWGRAVED